MTIDVASCIGELLYEYNSVIIPGVGGFVAKYKEAAIDQLQGTVSPPSKELNFNTNLVLNDGILVNHVKNKHQLAYEEARGVVDGFVEQLKEALENGQKVVIPLVGELYQDYRKNIQFRPESQNYNTDTYGLPNVQFYPIIREKADLEEPAKEEVAIAPAPLVTKSSRTDDWLDKAGLWFQEYLPYLAVAALMIVVLGLYFVLRDPPPADPTADANDKKENPRINQKPGDDKDTDTSLSDEITEEDENADFENEVTTVDEEEDENYQEEDKPDTDGITTAPGQKSCVIIIGGFGDKRNAAKRTKLIYEEGYEAYTDKKRNIHRVGIIFNCEDPADVDRMLRYAQRKFDRRAWVLPEEERK